jgi:hypothetical protein
MTLDVPSPSPLLPVPVVLHLVELLLCLWAVSSLPQPLHIEVCCFGDVVFWRSLSFVVGQPYLVVCVTVTLVGQDLCVSSVSLSPSSNRLSDSSSVVPSLSSSVGWWRSSSCRDQVIASRRG